MNDLNCPNCGTTYLSSEPGSCECCGYEFTSEFINQFKAVEKKQQKEMKKKAVYENLQNQLAVKKAKIEQAQKTKAEKKSRRASQKEIEKERKDRERVITLIKKEETQQIKDQHFSVCFKKARKICSQIGMAMVALSLVALIFFSKDISFINPFNIVQYKLSAAFDTSKVLVYYDKKINLYQESSEGDDSKSLSKGYVNLYNSISLIIQNQDKPEEKLCKIFPKTMSFIYKMKNDSNTAIDDTSDSSQTME